MEKRRSYVYKIMCKITGEFYFGSSFYAKSDYYWGKGRKIKERISMYGKENFVKEILGEFDDRTIAHQVENDYIEHFINDEKCLNERLEHKFGLYGEESRTKIGEANAIAMLGKHLSEETRAKMSASHLGKHFSKEHRAKIGAANRGKHRTEEMKQKIRESLKGSTPWNKGKKLNKETGEYE